MAVLAKKFNIQKTGASTVSCNIYSTTTEAGSSYMNCTVNGVDGTHYVALGTTSDSNATVGRVQKGSTTYAIKSQAKPPYAEQSWTTAGTYTWTAPAGVTRVRVAVVGGGGGSAIMSGEVAATISGTAGGESSFGSFSASGGGGGTAQIIAWTYEWSRPSGGTTTMTRYSGKGTAGTGGNNGGLFRFGVTPAAETLDSVTSKNYGTGVSPTNRSSGSCTAGAGYALSFTKTSGSYGTGDYGTGSHRNYAASWAGAGSGYFNTGYVDVTPGQTYTVVVGNKGTSNTKVSGTSYTATAYNSNTSGFVLIGYGGDI